MNISIFFLIHLLVSLAAGGYTAYRIKDNLVAIVLRLMPMRYKVSENAVYLHGRIATVLTLVIISLVGATTYYGIHRATRAWLTTESTVEVVEVPRRSTPARNNTSTYITPIPVDTPAVSAPTSYDEVEAKPTRPRHVPYVEAPATEKYYIQIGAYTDRQKAIRQRNLENKKGNMQCIIGVQTTDAIPYKLLLGPFVNHRKAKTYILQYRIKGYPKPAEQIDHFLRPAATPL